jgi:protein-arginine kinase activator protein McsA
VETCPKCGRKEPQLTVVIDSKTLSKKELCSSCAQASIGPSGYGISIGANRSQVERKKWWQLWK